MNPLYQIKPLPPTVTSSPPYTRYYETNFPFIESFLGGGKFNHFIHPTGFIDFRCITGTFSSLSGIKPLRLSAAEGRGQPSGYSGRWSVGQLKGSLLETFPTPPNQSLIDSTIVLSASLSGIVFNSTLIDNEEWKHRSLSDTGDKTLDHSFLKDVRHYLSTKGIDSLIDGMCWWSVASLRYHLHCHTHLWWGKCGHFPAEHSRVDWLKNALLKFDKHHQT